MKHLANIISLCRIILSVSLIFFRDLNEVFILIYLLCGLSDILDGYIARKFNIQSILGAKIDSFADLFMFIIIAFILITQASNVLITFLPIIIIIFLIRITNIIISFYKYHTFVIIHTWGNKLTGLLIFILPILLHSSIFLILISVVATLSAIEELFIHLFVKKLDINRKGLFFN